MTDKPVVAFERDRHQVRVILAKLELQLRLLARRTVIWVSGDGHFPFGTESFVCSEVTRINKMATPK